MDLDRLGSRDCASEDCAELSLLPLRKMFLKADMQAQLKEWTSTDELICIAVLAQTEKVARPCCSREFSAVLFRMGRDEVMLQWEERRSNGGSGRGLKRQLHRHAEEASSSSSRRTCSLELKYDSTRLDCDTLGSAA